MTKTIMISFTQDQLRVLDSALCELPYKIAAPLIAHINKEISNQQEGEEDRSASDSR